MRQPLLGTVATVLAIVASMVFIRVLGTDLFMGWASFALMGAIPFALVVGLFWKGTEPKGIANLSQPTRGSAYLALAAAVATIVSFVHWAVRGGSINPPAPMAVMTIITSVVVTFFLVLAFDGWPFSLMENKLLAGVVLLVTAYALNGAVFQCFSFAFAKGAPFYRAALDPGGPFAGWDVVTVMVTALAGLFLFLHLDLWPITRVAALRRQPALGVALTLACLALGLLVFWVGTSVLGQAAPTFLVKVPIPFLFGSIVLLVVLEGSLLQGTRQPARGAVTAVASAVLGVALSLGYAAMMPTLSTALPAGQAGDFAAEVWLANSLLAVTFPFLSFFGDFFQQWPLAARTSAQGPSVSVT